MEASAPRTGSGPSSTISPACETGTPSPVVSNTFGRIGTSPLTWCNFGYLIMFNPSTVAHVLWFDAAGSRLHILWFDAAGVYLCIPCINKPSLRYDSEVIVANFKRLRVSRASVYRMNLAVDGE